MPRAQDVPTGRHAASDVLDGLFTEVVSLYDRLTADAAAIHRLGALSGPRRTVLVGLSRSGPRTVAHMARARAQSRQRFQPLVNRLLAEGLVERRPNPLHRRSPLIALTPRGERQVSRIVETERALQALLELKSSPGRIKGATAVIREIRLALEQQLPRLLQRQRRRSRRPPR